MKLSRFHSIWKIFYSQSQNFKNLFGKTRKFGIDKNWIIFTGPLVYTYREGKKENTSSHQSFAQNLKCEKICVKCQNFNQLSQFLFIGGGAKSYNNVCQWLSFIISSTFGTFMSMFIHDGCNLITYRECCNDGLGYFCESPESQILKVPGWVTSFFDLL